MSLSCSRRAEAPARLLPRVAALLPLLALAPACPTLGQEYRSGTVYVESNTPDNAILAYRRGPLGNLSPLPGMPFSTEGSGVHPTSDLSPANLGPFDSDQNIIISGNRLFAVNSGSDTIAVFNIRPNGGLVPVAGSPFPSGGVNPVSVGIANNVLVVANKDYDLGRPGFTAATRRPNYASFRVDKNGRLIPIPRSTIVADSTGIAGPGHSVPTQMLVTPGKKVVFDANFLGFTIESFVLRPDGRLSRAASRRLPTGESPTLDNPLGFPVPLGLAAHPRAPVLYVGMVLDHKVAVYDYNPGSGDFRFVRTVAGTGDVLSGACWLLPNRQGTRLYVANNFSNTISVLNIQDPRQPTILQTLVMAQGVGLPEPFTGRAAPFQIALDPGEGYLHVVTQLGVDGQNGAANSLQILRVGRDGLLTFASGVILDTAPSRPQGVAAR